MNVVIIFALFFLVIVVFSLLNITPFFTLVAYDALSMSDASALGSLVAGFGSLVAIVGLYFSISQQNRILKLQGNELAEAKKQSTYSELAHLMAVLNYDYIDSALKRLDARADDLWLRFLENTTCSLTIKPDEYAKGDLYLYGSVVCALEENVRKLVDGDLVFSHGRVRVENFIGLHAQLFGMLETINSIWHLTKRISEIYTDIGRQSDFRAWAQSHQIYIDEGLVDKIFESAECLEKWFVGSEMDFDVEKNSFAAVFAGERPFTGVRHDIP